MTGLRSGNYEWRAETQRLSKRVVVRVIIWTQPFPAPTYPQLPVEASKGLNCFFLELLITLSLLCLWREESTQPCIVLFFLFKKVFLRTYYGQASVNSLNGLPKIFPNCRDNSLVQIPLTNSNFLPILFPLWKCILGSFLTWNWSGQKTYVHSYLSLSQLSPTHSEKATQPAPWFPSAFSWMQMRYSWLIPKWVTSLFYEAIVNTTDIPYGCFSR